MRIIEMNSIRLCISLSFVVHPKRPIFYIKMFKIAFFVHLLLYCASVPIKNDGNSFEIIETANEKNFSDQTIGITREKRFIPLLISPIVVTTAKYVLTGIVIGGAEYAAESIVEKMNEKRIDEYIYIFP